MSVAAFSRYHPIAYQRMLAGCLAIVLVCGMASVASAHHVTRGYSFDELTLPLPTATVAAKVQPAPLTQLPGADGSASPTTAAAATVVPAGGDLRQLGQVLNAIQFGSDQW
ncbi:MAG TPA: hypothetical protein VMR75_04175, partial [Candidatus Saccharimonadales bacterium]|nr:hypothetical protein [Candidatus Saccharimonadales bacterium]